MKLVRYGQQGKEKPGLIDSNGKIRDLSAYVPDFSGAALGKKVLTKLSRLKHDKLPLVRGRPRIGPCVPRIGNFIGVGLNYADHAAETGAAIPKEPILFSKAPSSLCGPNDDIVIPKGSVKTDWEVELAIVIGERCAHVAEKDALSVIAGFTICNDVSERAYQTEGTGQWMKGKSSQNFGPLGPWLVTPDEIANVQKLGMWLEVNGRRMQTGSTATMIFGVPFLVAYISKFMVLEPGDVITTGTPPGVGMGMKPPVYLKPGDIVRLGVEGLGEQKQPVSAWQG